MNDALRDRTRAWMLKFSLVLGVVVVVFLAGMWGLHEYRLIREASPEYVQAVGIADVLAASADAVRADTRTAEALAWAGLMGLLLCEVAVFMLMLAVAVEFAKGSQPLKGSHTRRRV